MADDTIPIGIKVDTTGVERAAASLDALAKKGEKAGESLKKVETSSASAGKNLSNLGGSAAGNLNEIGSAAQRAADDMEDLADASRDTANAMQSASGSMGIIKSAIGGFISAFTVQQMLQLNSAFLNTADAVTNLNTQLKLATGSSTAAAAAYADLLAVAQRSRVEFVELGKTYAQIARASESFGLSGKDTLRVTETLAKAITISGVSASSASAALVQLSQGMASGTLRGEELNSIMEQTPRIARALADGLGVPIGKLREMGAEGQLTGEKVAAALLKASESVDKEFGQSVTTVGQGFTVLSNATTDLVGKLDTLTGYSTTTATGIVRVADALGEVSKWVDKLNGDGVPPILSAVLKMGAFGAAASGNPLNVIPGYALFKSFDEARARARDASGREYDQDAQQVDDLIALWNKESKAAEEAAAKMAGAVDKFAAASSNLSRAQQKQAEQNKLLTEFSNVVRGYAQNSAEYLRAYNALQQGLRNIDSKFAPKGGGGGDSAAAKAQRDLNDAIAEGLGVRRDYVEQLRVIETLRDSGRISEEESIRFLERLIAQQPAVTAQLREQAEIRKALDRVDAEYIKTRQAALAAETKANSALDESIRKLKNERDEMGLSESQLNTLRAARENEADAQEIQRLQSTLDDPRAEADVANTQRRIDKLRELMALRLEIANAKNLDLADRALTKAAEDAAAAWQRTADEINRALTDSLFRAAESGKSIFEGLRDAIKGLFANLILRPIISGTLGTITGALGLTGTANAATSGLGSLSSLAGLGGAFGAFGSGFSSGLTAWSAGGSVTGLLSQGSALFSGGIASGLGTIAGALAPIGLALAGLVALLNRGGGPKGGGQSIVDFAGGVVSSSALQTAVTPGGGRILYTPNASDADLSRLTQGIGTAVANAITRLGGTAGAFSFGLGFDTDPQGKASNRISSFLTAGGADVYRQSNLDLGRDAEALQQGIATEVVRLTVAGLQAADLPAKIAAVFDAIDLASATQDQLTAALETAQGFVQLSQALDLVGISLDAVSDAAIEAAGGAAAAAQTVSNYYRVTRTAGEELVDATRLTSEAFGRLGQALPSSVQAYRDLVENPIVAANSELQLSLMALAPAIEAIYGPLEELKDVSRDTASSVSELVAALELERAGVQEEMDGLIVSFGDLSQTLAELETPAETVADTFIRLGREIVSLNTDMQRILGTVDKTKIEQLSDAVATRNAITGARGSVQDQITAAQLRGFANRNDLAGGVALLQGIEDGLWGQLETTLDPAGVAAKLTNVIAQRYDMEARLAEQARDTRRDALEDEIDRLEQLQDIARGISDTLLDLRTGSLSALGPRAQLAVSSSDFQSVLKAAQGGDLDALKRLASSGTQYLTEAQSFFASGGEYASTFAQVTSALDAVGLSLGDVPTQLSVAQAQLTSLDTVADHTGAMVTDLQTLDTTLGTLATKNETTISGLVFDIRKLIADMVEDRTSLETEFNANRERWTALDGHLRTIDLNIQALRNNSDLATTA